MFDPREATIATVHGALKDGITVLEIVQAHLARIDALDPTVNAILTLTPTVLQDAAAIDQQIRAHGWSPATHPLLGVPVLLKDAYDLAGLPTTGGCLALATAMPLADAPVVQRLKRAGAVILGKTNQHELALEGLSVSSLGGQTLNPFDLGRTPGGSSGGSAVAVAMSFAVVATGGDTMNSLRSPASANSIVSIRPTHGVVPTQGVMPLSVTQDVLGPFGKNVHDAAVLLQVMESANDDGFVSSGQLIARMRGYLDSINQGSLDGKRIGVLQGFFGSSSDDETREVNNVMQARLQNLADAGVELVTVTDAEYDADAILRDLDTQRFEFQEQTNAYLGRLDRAGQHPRTLKAIIDSGEFMVIPAQHAKMRAMLTTSTGSPEYAQVKAGIHKLKGHLHATFETHRLDAIIYPQQRNLVVRVGAPSQSGRNGILAAETGFPVVALPAGFSSPHEDAPQGIPVGMELLGRPWSERNLLSLAMAIESQAEVRQPPLRANFTVAVESPQAVPQVELQKRQVPAAYPIGML